MNDSARPVDEPPLSPFLPLLLMAMAVTATLAFQCYVLMTERESLTATAEKQNEPIEQAQRIRTQFQNVLGGAAKLAQEGNQNAVELIAELRERGINVRLTDGGLETETTP